MRAAVARLGIAHPVLLDTDFALWQEYENAGWPGRYLWGPDGMLVDYHYGEGAYDECERAIGELLGVAREPLAPLRPEDAPGARLVAPSPDRLEPPFDGPYEAGARVGGARPAAAGAARRTAASSRSSTRARTCSIEHDAPQRRRARARARRAACAATASASRPGWHAGCRARECAASRSLSSRTSRGGARRRRRRSRRPGQ